MNKNTELCCPAAQQDEKTGVILCHGPGRQRLCLMTDCEHWHGGKHAPVMSVKDKCDSFASICIGLLFLVLTLGIILQWWWD